jgi:hypothetical protein
MLGNATRKWVLAIILPAMLALSGCSNMASLVLFSSIEGQLVNNGQPVAGSLITRTWFWHNKDVRGSDSTTTDAQGRFTLPAVTSGNLMARLMPHEPVVQQQMHARIGNDDVKLWGTFKRNYLQAGEFDRYTRTSGGTVRIVCDIAAPEAEMGEIIGRCRPADAKSGDADV